MTVPHWVVDTNVLVSAAITPGGICDQVLQHAIAGRFVPAWDNKILAEYREVLSRRKFGLTLSAIRTLLAAFPAAGFHRGQEIAVKLPAAADLPFLAVALATEDKIIITGDAAHFPRDIMRECGISILTPRNALGFFEK